jgi:hypothetical protein
MDYLTYLIKTSLRQNNPLENSAMGELVERAVNQTYAALNRTFQNEVVARNIAQYIASHP